MTFLKKNTTKKESVGSIGTPKKIYEKKNSNNNSTISSNNNNINNNNNNNNNSKNFEEDKNIKKGLKFPTHISKSLMKINSLNSIKSPKSKDKISNSELEKNIYHRNTSIFPNACLTNSSQVNGTLNSNVSSNLKKSKIYKKSYSKKEKVFYSAFTNLSTTQEKSFQLNSSYDNINTISCNNYIKNKNLQNKTKSFIMNECKNMKKGLKKKGSFLKLPNNSGLILNLSNINCEIDSKYSKSSNKNNNNNNCLINRSNSFRLNLKNETNIGTISNKFNNFSKNKILSSNRLIEIKKLNKFNAIKDNFDIKKAKSPIIESRKIKKKGINKKLNKISKNIQITSKNINNPEEFYMNLFNNIIAKETRSFNGDDNERNSNTLNENSDSRAQYNSLGGKNSNGEITIVDSLISNKGSVIKDSNKNMIKIKKKRSIFGNNNKI